MACFEHPKGEPLDVPAGEEVLLNRRPANDNDLVRAYVWRPCGHSEVHNVGTPNQETMSVKAKLLSKTRFKSAGICCDDDGERRALFVWPGNPAAFKLL